MLQSRLGAWIAIASSATEAAGPLQAVAKLKDRRMIDAKTIFRSRGNRFALERSGQEPVLTDRTSHSRAKP
jgi:hypothetical protein